MNAYFRLIISQTGTAIELIPQTNGGSPLSIDEIAAYLQLKGIADYDIKLIYQAIGKLKDKPVQIPLCGMRSYQENEVVRAYFLRKCVFKADIQKEVSII